MVERSKGQNNNSPFIKKASTAMSLLDIVSIDANGYVIPAVTASTVLLGLVQENIKSSDDDYAKARMVVVDVPRGDRDEFIIDVTGGTLTQANVGKAYDLSDAKTLNIATGGTVKHCKVVGIVSTTKASVVFNTGILFA